LTGRTPEATKDPPNQPWLEVYEKVAGDTDASIAAFDAALDEAMVPFGEATR
jgi:hypothetical protein